MTAMLERVPLERISAEARQARPGRTALLVIAGVLFAVGWAAAKVAGVVWLALAWSATAVKVGWAEARQPRPADPGGV
jgi:hypothetical protein